MRKQTNRIKAHLKINESLERINESHEKKSHPETKSHENVNLSCVKINELHK